RRLAEAPRGEDHDVLAVADVGLDLGDLLFAVREGLVEGQSPEAERVHIARHADQRNAELRYRVTRSCVTRRRVIRWWRAPRPPRTTSRRSSRRPGRARAWGACAAGRCRT